MTMASRIALVDDHTLFRYSLAAVLRTRGFDIVAEAATARESFPLIDQARPDVVLLDLRLPGMDGITAAREMTTRPAKPKVLMLSAYDSSEVVAAAFEAGVRGYAIKSMSIESLIDGIHAVAQGQRYLAPTLSPLAAKSNGPLAVLSTREREVFRLIVAGHTMRDIALQLCISIKTAQTHRQRIFTKLDIHTAVKLVRYAAVHDLLLEPAQQSSSADENLER
jgi:two-component system response regulator NreC